MYFRLDSNLFRHVISCVTLQIHFDSFITKRVRVQSALYLHRFFVVVAVFSSRTSYTQKRYTEKLIFRSQSRKAASKQKPRRGLGT